jgi:hypothetical protein
MPSAVCTYVATIEPLEGRQLLAAEAGFVGPLQAPSAAAAAATTEERAPRRAAAEAEPSSERPSVTATRPATGATDQPRNLFVAADVLIPNVGHGVDADTLKSSTVKLIRTRDNVQVPANANTSGGGDSIVLTPTGLLEANTQYKFVVTEGVKDTTGAAFRAFSSTFTTGDYVSNTLDPSIKFTRAQQDAATGQKFTGLAMGPDDRLYAGTLDGKIIRYDVAADGSLSAPFEIDTVTANNGGPRTITGIKFGPLSTASNLILWVSHGQFAAENATDWTGKLSRLSGASLESYRDAVVGLPRSVRDHLSNQFDFGSDGHIYISQGSNNSMGAPDRAWGMRPERLLTAAVLKVDLSRIRSGTVNVQTEDGGTYDPFAPNAPVTIYASGVRNAFDLVWHSNGSLYAPTNGAAAGGSTPGFAAAPADPADPTAAAAAPQRIDEGSNGPYTGPDVPGLENVRETQDDFLYRIEHGGYYGHPNPLRGEYVLNGGNPTAGTDANEVRSYPVGTEPDRNYRGAAWRFGKSYSPDGIIEYRSGAFGGALAGRLFVTRYSGGDDVAILEVDASGNIVRADTGIQGLTNFKDPLDLVEDRRNGNLYVVEHGAEKITLARPVSDGNGAPVMPTIETQPKSQRVPEGQPATFAVIAAGNGLRYQWLRNDVPIPGATGASYAINAVARADDGARFRVVVTNDAGAITSGEATLALTFSRPPVASIAEPSNGTPYAGGQTIAFAGLATDPDEGTLPPGAYTWEVTFHRPNQVRAIVAPFSGATGGQFQVPTDGETTTATDGFFRIRLTVRDATGQTAVATADLAPRLGSFSIASNLPDVPFTLDGAPVGLTSTIPGVIGVNRVVGAPDTHTVNGVVYEFVSWSDGGAATHAIAVPETAATYVATYQPRAGDPGPGPGPGPGDPPPGPGPDLTVSAVDAVPVGAVGRAGRATVRVANTGTLPFSGAANIELFLSGDATLDGGDAAVGSYAKRLKLKAAASKPVKMKLVYPSVPADGDYFLIARAVAADPGVETDPANGVGASGTPVPVRNPVVELSGILTGPPANGVVRGGRGAASLGLLNGGSIATAGPLGLTLFAVAAGADPAVAGNRVELVTLTKAVKINPDKAKRIKFAFIVPATLAPGNYSLAVAIDTGNAFAEPDEQNNVAVSPLPLVVV